MVKGGQLKPGINGRRLLAGKVTGRDPGSAAPGIASVAHLDMSGQKIS